jgi:hypothetical protein
MSNDINYVATKSQNGELFSQNSSHARRDDLTVSEDEVYNTIVIDIVFRGRVRWPHSIWR